MSIRNGIHTIKNNNITKLTLFQNDDTQLKTPIWRQHLIHFRFPCATRGSVKIY